MRAARIEERRFTTPVVLALVLPMYLRAVTRSWWDVIVAPVQGMDGPVDRVIGAILAGFISVPLLLVSAWIGSLVGAHTVVTVLLWASGIFLGLLFSLFAVCTVATWYEKPEEI